MATEDTVWARTAYVRTVQIPTTGTPTSLRDEYWDFLYRNVHQWKGRHRYIFGASSAADETILTFMLDRTNRNSAWYKPDQPRVELKDLLVYVPENSASTAAGRTLLRRLETSGIQYTLKGATAEECDEAMLWKSDYVLDQLTMTLAIQSHEIWPGNAYRHGVLTKEEGKKVDYSQFRLRDKQGKHSFRDCSGMRRPRGESFHRCVHCGQKCKRNRPCRTTGLSQGIEVWRRNWSPPPNGDVRWRELTSQDLIMEYRHSGTRRSWQSTETFSGI